MPSLGISRIVTPSAAAGSTVKALTGQYAAGAPGPVRRHAGTH
jgi:hypothetical protein